MEYPNILFRGTSAWMLTSPEPDSVFKMMPFRRLICPMMVPWNSTGAVISTVIVGSKMAGFALMKAGDGVGGTILRSWCQRPQEKEEDPITTMITRTPHGGISSWQAGPPPKVANSSTGNHKRSRRETLLEGHLAGDAESQLRRVHGMSPPISQRDSDIPDRVPNERSLFHCLSKPLGPGKRQCQPLHMCSSPLLSAKIGFGRTPLQQLDTQHKNSSDPQNKKKVTEDKGWQ